MIFDATGIEGLTQRLWELGVCAAVTKFVERPVREQEERAVYGDVPDLNRLRRWLRGDATARFDACGGGLQAPCHERKRGALMLEVYPHYTGDGYGAEWYDPSTGGWMHWAWEPLEAVAGLMEMVAKSLEESKA